MTPHLTAIAGFVLAFYPTLSWYFRRLRDGGDEPLGLLVLALGIALGVRALRHAKTPSRPAPWIALGFMTAYLVTTLIVPIPPIFRATLAIGCVGSYFGFLRHAGVFTLLLLSLPVITSLQFYAGYPLRLVTSIGATALLDLGNLPVAREGVDIVLAGQTIGVDAPCSGIRMLWSGAVYAAALGALHRLGWIRTSVLLGTGALAVVLANIVRATILALPESGKVHWPSVLHDLVGLLSFLIAVVAVGWVGGQLALKPAHRRPVTS